LPKGILTNLSYEGKGEKAKDESQYKTDGKVINAE